MSQNYDIGLSFYLNFLSECRIDFEKKKEN